MKKSCSNLWKLPILGIVALSVRADPPPPPPGFQWLENPAYTDEFNGTALDAEKWYDHHPRWKGRPPARFMPENVSVDGGTLRLTNGMLPEKQEAFTMGGAAVVSKKVEAFYGYYECRMKASSISMSSTFWMSHRGKDIPGVGRVAQELDIQETIGGAKKNKSFRTRMNSNTHVWHNQESTSVGNHADIAPASDEAFHVYGCWWENATTVHFYWNGKHVGTVHPSPRYSETPFDSPMHINMVTETYDWETPPTPEEINVDVIAPADSNLSSFVAHERIDVRNGAGSSIYIRCKQRVLNPNRRNKP